MESVNNDWLNSLNLVNELQKGLTPSFVNDGWNYILGQIKNTFAESFKKGLVLDTDAILKKLDEYVSRNDDALSRSSAYADYKEALIEANFQTRKKTFIDYVQMDDETLEQAKEKELEAYRELLANLKSYSSDRMGPDYSTVTVDMVVDVNGKSEIRSDSRVPFDNAYDVIATYFRNTQYSSEKVLGKTHEAYIAYVQGVIDKFTGMTPSEFKEHKIGLLKLSDEEVKRINDEFSNDLESTVGKSNDVAVENTVVPSVNIEDVANIHHEDVLEPVVEEVPTFTSILAGKMGNYPAEFKTAIIDCLSNVCEFDVNNSSNVVTVAFDRVDELAPSVKVLSGKMQVFDSSEGVSRAVDYHLSSNGDETKMYNCTVNLDNSRYSFQYNESHPERGVNVQVHKHKAVNTEPRFGINGIEYDGTILPDGSISARGISTNVPSMYDTNGMVRKVSKFKTGDFTCFSYQELENVTNQSLGFKNSNNPTLS